MQRLNNSTLFLDDDQGLNRTTIEEGEIDDYYILDFDCYFFESGHSNESQNDDLVLSLINHEPCKGFKKFREEKQFMIKLGSSDVCQALELSVRYLKVNECAIVSSHSKYAHPYGRKSQFGTDLPTNARCYFRVRVNNIMPYMADQSYSFRLNIAKQLKAIGNDYYINEWIGPKGEFGKVNALRKYNASTEELMAMAKDLKEESEKDITLEREVCSLLVDCFNNISAVHYRDKEYTKSKEAAIEVIKLDPDNVKALIRAGKCALLTGCFEECLFTIQTVRDIDKDNKDLHKLQLDYREKMTSYRNKEKKMYENMLKAKDNNKVRNGSHEEDAKDCRVISNDDQQDRDEQELSKKSRTAYWINYGLSFCILMLGILTHILLKE